VSDAHRTLLVPLDGSEFAEKALAPAARQLSGRGATLHLVSVVTPFPVFLPSDVDDEHAPGWFAEEGMRVREYLDQASSRAEAMTDGVEVTVHAPTGHAAPTLVRIAGEVGADLVVMTAHGRSAIGRAWIGSVADRVMRQAPCPVLLLTGDELALDASVILVAMDGSETAEEALAEAAKFARVWDGRLVLAMVVPRPRSIAVPYLDLSAESERIRMDREVEAKAYLERLAAPLRGEGLRADVVTSRDDDIVPGLMKLRERHRAGLVAMGTQGRGGVARLLMGSVATRVVHESPVPVLLVPPRTTG
jgi:nucleotide-binding universal stress UspA family protein